MSKTTEARSYCANGCARRIKRQRAAYCSRDCQLDHYRRRVIALWRAGALPPRLYFNRTVRRHIIEAVGEKCQRCGWSDRNPFTGRVPLEIEHVDGDWRNNTPGNIRVLCPNCHALTATFRGANRGRGRPGRPGCQTTSPAPRPFRWTEDIPEPWNPPEADRYHGGT